jgi:hypothetical protein
MAACCTILLYIKREFHIFNTRQNRHTAVTTQTERQRETAGKRGEEREKNVLFRRPF